MIVAKNERARQGLALSLAIALAFVLGSLALSGSRNRAAGRISASWQRVEVPGVVLSGGLQPKMATPLDAPPMAPRNAMPSEPPEPRS